MPFKSDAQRRYMNWAAKEGKISQKTVNEFNKASKGKSLPERANKNKARAKKILEKMKK